MTMMIFIHLEVVGLSVVRSLSSMPQFLPFPELLTSNNATQHTTVVHGEMLVKVLPSPGSSVMVTDESLVKILNQR